MLSHSDSDHINGAIDILENGKIDIKFIRFNSDIKLKSRENYIRLLRLINDLSCKQKKNGKQIIDYDASLTPNLNNRIDKGFINIEILAPSIIIAGLSAGSIDPFGNRIETNSISAIIRLNYKGKNLVLLPGDIDYFGLENLLKENEQNNEFTLNADLIVYPHHGGKSNNSSGDKYKELEEFFVDRLLKLVNPSKIIFSVGNNNLFPNQIVLDFILKKFPNIEIFSTGDSPNVRKVINDKIHNNVGTISIDLINGNKVSFIN